MFDVMGPRERDGTRSVVRACLNAFGDRVEVNDPLVELETDNVAVEVPAPAAGVLKEIVLETDAEALPGAVLGRIGTEEAEESVRPERNRGAPAPILEKRPSTTLDRKSTRLNSSH